MHQKWRNKRCLFSAIVQPDSVLYILNEIGVYTKNKCSILCQACYLLTLNVHLNTISCIMRVTYIFGKRSWQSSMKLPWRKAQFGFQTRSRYIMFQLSADITCTLHNYGHGSHIWSSEKRNTEKVVWVCSGGGSDVRVWVRGRKEAACYCN